MPKSILRIVATAAAAASLCLVVNPLPAQDNKPAAATTQATTVPAPAPSPELATRYASLAQETLRQKNVVLPHFKQAAGLLTAAMRLDPNEPRYPRMLYEAMLELGDTDGALKALRTYRGINQQTADDQWAMVNYIDLSARAVETAEGRFDFYKKYLASRAPDPVKAHAAFRAAQVARERGQTDVENDLLNECLKLNPLNLDALRARLARQTENGTPAERTATLLAMLRSNPAQPAVSYRLARDVADVGLVEEALRYYTLSVNVSTAAGAPLGRDFAIDYGSELYLMNQPQLLAVTKTIVEQLLKQDSGDAESLFLRWLTERAGEEKEAAAKTGGQVVNAALNRLLAVRQQLGVTGPGATTRPVESAEAVVIPDLSEDLRKLKDEKLAPLADPYAQAATDLAWYLVFVAKQPAEAQKLVPTLRALVSETHPVVVRIEGWIFLAQNQLDQAGVKLKAVADQDVLARAGTILLRAKNPAEKQPTADDATKLLQQHPSGLLAAVLVDTFREFGAKVTPRGDAADVKKAVDDFPKDWFRIIDAPQTFYQLKGEMTGGRVLYPFGDPMMAAVTIRNASQFDITVGPEGTLRQDLWFDAQFRGLVQQLVTGAAYERLGQFLVLKPGQSVTQFVRMDQGQLAQLLAQNPNPSLSFYGQVRTNPRESGSGPCGYGVAFTSITERSGFPINENSLRALSNLVANGTLPEKLRSLDLVAAEIPMLAKQKEKAGDKDKEQFQGLIVAFADLLNQGTRDADPNAATWASFLLASVDATKVAAIRDRLLADPEPARRVIGLMAANAMPLDEQKKLVARVLETDKEPMVQLYASGMHDIARMIAEQPTTAPAAATRPAAETPSPTAPPTPKPPTPNPAGDANK